MKCSICISFLTVMLLSAASCTNVKTKSFAPGTEDNAVEEKVSEEKVTEKEVQTESVSDLADNLKVNDSATKEFWKIRLNLQKEGLQFSDRKYVIEELPDIFAGADYIHTPADAKKFTDPILATMTAKQNVDVYIAYDTRIVQMPEWMTEWESTDEVIVNSEANPTTFGIYKKSYNKGDLITFGNNGQSSGCLMYMIFFTPPEYEGVVREASDDDSNVPVTWPACLGKSVDWFTTEEGLRVADNLILYQYNTGGWGKNIDMAQVLTNESKQKLLNNKTNSTESTIDNDATTQQILFLAKAYTYTKEQRFKDAAIKGIAYILEAQYPSGGWPQYYPVNKDTYYAHITFNDNAMTNVMELLETIVNDDVFSFVDEDTKSKIKIALDKGVSAILKTQIIQDGKKTAWCAQHYAETLLPAPARAYELESISGYESIAVIRYLMSIKKPTSEIIEAVQAAVAWFDAHRIDGIIVKEISNPELDGKKDKVVVEDDSAPPVWARFYDLETGKPFFCGREGVKKETFAEIEHERRMGYSYYTTAPMRLLAKDYPVWQKKHAPDNNVLTKAY